MVLYYCRKIKTTELERGSVVSVPAAPPKDLTLSSGFRAPGTVVVHRQTYRKILIHIKLNN